MGVFSLSISVLYLWAWLWWIFKHDHAFSEWNDPAKYTHVLWGWNVAAKSLMYSGRLYPATLWCCWLKTCALMGCTYLPFFLTDIDGFCCTDWFPPLGLLIACFQFCTLLTVHFSLQCAFSVCMLGVCCLCDTYTICSVHVQLNLVGNAIIFVSEHIVHFCCFWTHALFCIKLIFGTVYMFSCDFLLNDSPLTYFKSVGWEGFLICFLAFLCVFNCQLFLVVVGGEVGGSFSFFLFFKVIVLFL